MKAFVRRRRALDSLTSVHREDPLSGVANLFDASIVFAIVLMAALIQAFSLARFLDPNSQFIFMKKDARAGQVDVIEKDHRDIKVKKMTPEKKGGLGVRLRVAYQLPDGSVVYVPESATVSKPAPVRLPPSDMGGSPQHQSSIPDTLRHDGQIGHSAPRQMPPLCDDDQNT
jgi:hypothetical protein